VDRQLSAMLGEPRRAAPEHFDAELVPPTSLDLRPMNSISVDGFAEPLGIGKNQVFTSALSRLRMVRPALEQILSDERVPKELVAVALVESGGEPFAISPRQARGLWQFMPETARHYGLAVGPDRDERVEVERSTRAAARYLRDLYDHFGNWPLALAAYSAGQGAVDKALRSSGTTTFWQLSANRKLPQETRNYVPAVLSAMRLLGPSTLQTGAPLKEKAPRWIYASSSPN
jgi:membrane-bound lytic murein transglycosylase D